ncbi:MAG: low molecular weight phosphotyrosine protein phosphatase [Micropruina sp.]|nr:MAG: low molecular weight phosphotyrosine protein phosphatase [Micropruina sp.]
MAERVLEGWAARDGVAVEVSSAGTSAEESGNPIDPRAARVLAQAGYRTAGHRAHRITAEEIRSADIVVAMEELHRDRMLRLVPDAHNIVLLTDYVPGAQPGSGVPDPWYGGAEGFRRTLEVVEAAMPGLLDAVRHRVAGATIRRSAT